MIHWLFHFSVYSTFTTYTDWQDNPTITTINTTAYPIKNVEFPAITICSQGAAKDVLDMVLLDQFEDYLNSKDIETKEDNANSNVTNEGKSNRTSALLSSTLTRGEVIHLMNHQLFDIYDLKSISRISNKKIIYFNHLASSVFKRILKKCISRS